MSNFKEVNCQISIKVNLNTRIHKNFLKCVREYDKTFGKTRIRIQLALVLTKENSLP